MQLVIAEKPSVAQSLAKVLGAVSRKDGYLEGGGYLVSWCVGHLVELASADCYDPSYSKWDYAHLPILPEHWQYSVSVSTKKQFDILKALLHRPDVDTIICATDAGREGELIFRLVYHQCGCKKPFLRLWISSMEDTAIRKGFDNLLDGRNYDTLYQAALCRAKADWLVGINGTRLFSCLYHKTLNVGRVMTPTLALLVEREATISTFRKEKFYTVELDLEGFRAVGEKVKSKTEGEKLRIACLGKTATVESIIRKEKTERPPKLFDLTGLQREANRIYGYTAQQTLDYTQALYEKKLATYPRTDSQYITEDMAERVPALVQTVSAAASFFDGTGAAVSVKPVTDNKKVSDHHAILPTQSISGVNLGELPTGERNILQLLFARLLCAVGNPHIYAETAVTLSCGGRTFQAKGRTVTECGWKAVWQSYLNGLRQKPEEEQTAPELSLPPLSEGQAFPGVQTVLREGSTSPPRHFTEDLLLQAMEHASAEDFADIPDLERKGLGTPATRAGVIEKLVKSGFVERKGKQLLPTKSGTDLISVLPDTVKSAKLTADWEAALKQVELEERSPEDFLTGIQTMLSDLVKTYAHVTTGANLFADEKEIIGKCPRCGRPVYEGKSSFYCSGYKDSPACQFALWKNNRFFIDKKKPFDKKLAAAFLKTGRVNMKQLFSEKKGMYYDATVVMQDTGEKFVQFKLEFPRKKGTPS